MPNALRHISVTVVEIRRGQFVWQLLEQNDDQQWVVFDQGKAAAGHYAKAMAAGLLRLQGLIDDLGQGPRLAETTNTSLELNSDKAASKETFAPPKERVADQALKSTVFGFGTLR